MPSARLPALLEGCAGAYLMREAVRNREAMGNGGKLVGSGRMKGIVLGCWSNCWRRLVMNKCSYWKIEQECELYANQDCLGQMRCKYTVCRGTGWLEEFLEEIFEQEGMLATIISPL